ncbi:MAG: M1 family aminopeptidase [Rhodothermales bacterium]
MPCASSPGSTRRSFPIDRLVLALMMLAAGACQAPDDDRLYDQGVSWELAEQRAATLSDIAYDVDLTIPAEKSTPITGRIAVAFTLRRGGAPVVLDFNQPADRIDAVEGPDGPVAYRKVNNHLVFDGLGEGAHVLTIAFTAGEASLNRNADYLYTLFVPDRASFAIPLFDQPNLKARYRLTLRTPADWEAVANAPRAERTEADGVATHRFEQTEPLPTYLFAFAAGRFQTETAERAGRTMTMYHRETDAAKVARNRDAIFDLHAAALAWLADYTGIAYPFTKFDFVLIPSFQYGGMEHAGAILYRSASLMLDASATKNQELGRASLIAHETAHMWFGDLVTMNWFDDVWTKEVFANFMAAKIVNPSFPEIDHDLRFLFSHYPAAYAIDRTEGANPIRQPLENLQMAGTLYGPIIYQKAPIVMKHLETMVGEDAFRDGLRDYLYRYRYGNATWPQLIEILDARSPRDLAAWSHVWVEEPGRPRIELEREAAGFRIAQHDPAGRGRIWPQRLDVAVAYADRTTRDTLAFETAEILAPTAGTPRYAIPNADGLAYGLFLLDPESQQALIDALPALADPLERGIAWLTLWDAMLEGRLAPPAFLDLAERSLPLETDELIVQRILGYAGEAFWQYTRPEDRPARAATLEPLLRGLLANAATPSRKAAYFNALKGTALTKATVDELLAVWRQETAIPGLTLAENDYSDLAFELALRRADLAAEILTEQEARIDNPDRKERFHFVSAALSPNAEVRAAFFQGLAMPANREHEPWALDGLAYLNHPLRAPYAEVYLLPALGLLEEIQRTGDIFFPARWLDALLGGHQTPTAARTVRDFLSAHPELSPRLRAKVLQSADGLFRAAALVSDPGIPAGEASTDTAGARIPH